ncbi:MAG: hypothetical protein IPK80_00370 [Nannocystis sp.]|nr:hypothetical protein [Nannocystis sp.]
MRWTRRWRQPGRDTSREDGVRGEFHGSSVVSEASKTIQGDLTPRYEAAMLGAFKNVMDQGKTYADVKKAVDARLTRFSPGAGERVAQDARGEQDAGERRRGGEEADR